MNITDIEGIARKSITPSERMEKIIEKERLTAYAIKGSLFCGLGAAGLSPWMIPHFSLLGMLGVAIALFFGIGAGAAVLFGTVMQEFDGWKLSHGLGVEARAFLKAEKGNMKALRRQIGSFNLGLDARKQSNSEYRRELDGDLYEADVADWAARQKALQAKVKSLHDRFHEATVAARARVEASALRETKIAHFRNEVEQLRRIERCLQLDSGRPIDGSVTRDLSSLVASAQLRKKLEREREELGLPGRVLPSQTKRKNPKALTAAT